MYICIYIYLYTYIYPDICPISDFSTRSACKSSFFFSSSSSSNPFSQFYPPTSSVNDAWAPSTNHHLSSRPIAFYLFLHFLSHSFYFFFFFFSFHLSTTFTNPFVSHFVQTFFFLQINYNYSLLNSYVTYSLSYFRFYLFFFFFLFSPARVMVIIFFFICENESLWFTTQWLYL